MTRLLPGLLGSTLSEITRLHPTQDTLTLNMVGTSEATLTIPEDAPSVSVHDWISLYTQSGPAGIFRVSNVAQNYKKQIDLTLLHGIDILSDSVWAAQLDFSGTKAQFLQRLLDQQTHLINGVKPWVLGVCEDSGNYSKTINYDRLSNLVEELQEEGGGYYFTYDQSVFPWVLNYVAKTSEVSSEFRLTRNVRSATVTYNDADLCTRLHLSVSVKGQDADTHVTSTDTVVRTYNNLEAQARWGVVVKTADIDTKDDIEGGHFANADEWAAHFLSSRSEPSVQIQIDGDDLSRLTGDSWDLPAIGRLCRVALPSYGHTFLERVVSITFSSIASRTPKITVSLANALPRVSETIASAQKTASVAASAARGASRSAADAKELTHWSQRVQYQGEALDGTGVLTLYESGIDMDATGGVTIYSLEQGLQALYSSIQVNAHSIEAESEKITLTARQAGVTTNAFDETASYAAGDRVVYDGTAYEFTQAHTGPWTGADVSVVRTLQAQITVATDAITQEVTDRTDADSTLSGRITTEAGRITAEVTRATGAETALSGRLTVTESAIAQEVTDRTDADTALSGRITTEAGKITQIVTAVGANGEVTAASIVAAVNAAGSTVKIGADHIILDGQVVANSLSSDDVLVSYLNVSEVHANSITAGEVTVDTGHGTIDIVDMEVRLEDVEEAADSAVGSIGPASASGGKITIPWTKNDGTAGTPINFNIADTQYYQDGVSAAYTDGWDAARAQVVPPSQGTDTTFTFKAPSAAEGQQQTYTFTVQKGATPASNGYASVALSGTVVGRIPIGDWYDAGVDSVSIANIGVSNDTHTGHPVTFDANAKTLSFYPRYRLSNMTSESYYSQITINDPGLYNAGYTAGQGSGAGSVTVDSVAKDGAATFSANKKTVLFPVTAMASNGATKTETVSCDVTESYNAGYSAGEDDVTLSAGGWAGPNGTNTITASNGKTAVVTLPSFTVSGGSSFSNHKTTVYFSTNSVTAGPLKSKEVDATSEYNAGYSDGYDDAAAASYDHMTFSSTAIGDVSYDYNPGTIKCTAYDGNGNSLGSDTLQLHMTQGSWNSSNKKAVNIRVGNASGNLIARLWVTAPSASIGTPYIQNHAQGYIRAVVVVNGQTYYGSAIKLSSSQISSWGGPI